MKKLSANILVMALFALTTMPAQAQLSEYDLNKPLGWATVGGSVTGSNDENPVTVTTLDQLRTAMQGTAKRTIYIKGAIYFEKLAVMKDAQNKTVYGLPGSELVNNQDPVATKKSGVLSLSNCKNVILRNLTFKSAGAYDIDGNDNLCVTNSRYIWIDHCDFQDGVDGNFDCIEASDNICVSWCRFRYFISPWAGGSGGSDDHRNSNLWGNSDSKTGDAGHLRTTFANCWWDNGCKERMPRVRFGSVHVVNCLYTSTGNNYCVGAGYKSNLYVEKCAFIDVKNPWKCYATSNGKTDYNITMADNIGADDVQKRSGSAEYFIPADHYTYEGFDKNLVQAVVGNEENGAGATLDIKEGDKPTTAISSPVAGGAAVVETQYFTASGIRLSKPAAGMNIIRQRMADGSVKTRKVMMR